MINDLPEGILLHILSLSVFHFEYVHPRHESPYQNQNVGNFLLLDLVGRLLNKSNRIKRLCVKIFKITVDADKVSYLISSAMKHEIQYLRLSLGDSNYQFMLPNSLSAFASLNELWLGLKFTLHIPSGICFPSLKKLVVSNVTFANGNSVQQLCYWKNIEEINVAISTLRNLRIRSNSRCVEYDHDMTLKIDVVNLLSLYCICIPTIEFVLVNLTSL
jgi:hypothetical protein